MEQFGNRIRIQRPKKLWDWFRSDAFFVELCDQCVQFKMYFFKISFRFK